MSCKNCFFLWSMLSIIFMVACARDVSSTSDDGGNSVFSTDSSSLVVDTTSYSEQDTSGTTTISCDGNVVSIAGSGVSSSGTTITISQSGTYIISGTLDDGQILVDAVDADVSLVLNGFTMTSTDNACIYVKDASQAIIILNADTENNLNDYSSYSDEEQNATIYSKSDLMFNGTGTLNISANYNDGITSKDGLIIVAGNYNINAIDDGIRGKDYLYIQDGNFTINSGGDALKSDNEDDGMGEITINSGSFNIISEADGIDANTRLFIQTGNFDIETAGGSKGSFSTSAKGLKAGSSIEIAAGSFLIAAADDAIHSNASLTINGGDYDIYTADDAFHADESLTINGGNAVVYEAYEGIESKLITIQAGNYYITSSDDGINAADASSTSFGPGSSSAGVYLHVNGGNIVLNAQGDAFDCNGTAAMTDGVLLIHGPTADNNGALDYDGSFNVSGGVILAAGSSGMAEAPSTSSSQNSIICYFSSTLSAGTLVNLQDENGETIYTFASVKSFSSIVISSSLLVTGASYSIYYGGSTTGENNNGLIVGGEYTEGTLMETFTISSAVTTIGTSSSSGGKPGRP